MKEKGRNPQSPPRNQIRSESPTQPNELSAGAAKGWREGMPLPDVRSLNPEDAEKLMERLDVDSALDFIENAPPKLKYDLIIASPKAKEIVERLSFEEIFFVVKAYGETSALELLELTTPEQFEGFLDLECWSKDRPNLFQTHKWMAILMAMDDDQFIERMAKIDRAFLISYFKKFFDVFKGEEAHEQFEPDEMTAFLSHDRRYMVRFKRETPENPFVFEVAQRIYRLDWQLFYQITEGIYWETETLVEEEAYENRTKRLQYAGFPEYYEALDIFAYRDPERFKPHPKDRIYTPDDDGEPVEPPSFPVQLAPEDSLLVRAMKLLDERKKKELQWEAVYLSNRYIVADRTDFSLIDNVRKSLVELHRIVNIGLESFAGDNPKVAAKLLTRFYLKDIFIKGNSLILSQKKAARAVLNSLKRWQPNIPQSLLDYPYGEFLEEITLTRPRFFTAITDRAKSQSRPFADLKEVQAAAHMIERLKLLVEVFEHLFPPERTSTRALAKVSINISDPTDIKLSTLFLTGLANRLMGQGFKPAPVSASSLKQIVEATIDNRHETPRLNEEFSREFFHQLDEFLSNMESDGRSFETLRLQVKPFFDEFLDKYLDELGHISNTDDIRPHLISCILIGR